MTEIILTPEFKRAFDIMEGGKNVFLTGKAGTGKSTLLRLFRDKTRREYAVVAPTGIAALEVGGQTIHKLFCLPFGTVTVERLRALRAEDKLKIKGALYAVQTLIVDEVSMVRADVLQGMDFILRCARNPRLPFGGVQVILIGDPYQLPPVVVDDEREHFAQEHSSPYFFDAEAFKAGGFTTVELQTVHRQKDEEFISALNAVRSGEVSDKHLATLNSTVLLPGEKLTPGTLALTTTNAQAAKFNEAKMARLPGEMRSFRGWYDGEFSYKNMPVPLDLTLKIGAQVMFVKNDLSERWVNGTIGVVTGFPDEGCARVRPIDMTSDVEVWKEDWEMLGWERCPEKKKVIEKIVGTYRHLPLVPAWACTIHKSQGRTLDHTYVHLGAGTFATGQLYVALSRCRTLQGLRLNRPVRREDVLVDQAVVNFMDMGHA